MRAENDTGSGGNNCHFITFDSGWSSDANSPPRMSGLTSDQLAWMKEDQKNAYANGKTHTFVFTHAPIVGHGGKMTHDVPFYENGEFARLIDHDRPFVEWVNGQDSDYPEGQYVEAVFVGHTHKNHIFYEVDISSLEGKDIYDWYSEYFISSIYFYSVDSDPENGICSSPVYIETTTATKGG